MNLLTYLQITNIFRNGAGKTKSCETTTISKQKLKQGFSLSFLLLKEQMVFWLKPPLPPQWVLYVEKHLPQVPTKEDLVTLLTQMNSGALCASRLHSS